MSGRRYETGAWGARRLVFVFLVAATGTGMGCIGWGVPDVARLPPGDESWPDGDSDVDACAGCGVCHVCNGGSCGNAEDGTRCPPPSGATAPWVCIEGTCAVSVCGDGLVDVRLSEQCDGGVTCLPSCRSKCVSVADCDDHNPCNGVESCNGISGTCNVGVAVVCAPAGLCGNPVCLPISVSTWACACP